LNKTRTKQKNKKRQMKNNKVAAVKSGRETYVDTNSLLQLCIRHNNAIVAILRLYNQKQKDDVTVQFFLVLTFFSVFFDYFFILYYFSLFNPFLLKFN
jgi:hypothetical protein